MAQNEIEIGAPPERVWAALADAGRYDEWVLGAQNVREADATWPAVGAKLHHSTGVGRLAVDDETSVEVCEPTTRLVLLAKVGTLGAFRVTFELTENPAGTTLRMQEQAVGGVAGHVPGTDRAIRARNTASLERLKRIAEETTPAPR